MRRDSSQTMSNKRARSVQDEDEDEDEGARFKRDPSWCGTGGDVHDYAQESYWADSAEDNAQPVISYSYGTADIIMLEGLPEPRGRSLERSFPGTI